MDSSGTVVDATSRVIARLRARAPRARGGDRGHFFFSGGVGLITRRHTPRRRWAWQRTVSQWAPVIAVGVFLTLWVWFVAPRY